MIGEEKKGSERERRETLTGKVYFRVLTGKFQGILLMPDMEILTMIVLSPSGAYK